MQQTLQDRIVDPTPAEEEEALQRVSQGRTTVAAFTPFFGHLVLKMEPVVARKEHRVDTAANGMEAYRKLESCQYDLIISDVRMPEMTGIELYGKLADIQPELKEKVIFTSGHVLDEETNRFVDQVGARAIAKPIDLSELLHIVSEMLHRPMIVPDAPAPASARR